jgi:hypothetical protein
MSSSDNTEEQPPVFGVPASTIAAALQDAGLTEDAIVAILGRAYSRSPDARSGSEAEAAAADRAAPFTFQVLISETAPECALTYERLFFHPDFIDGVTVVQAGETPDEVGFNSRFHQIEAEFDSISRDLQTSSNCVAELRRQVFQMARELEAKITEIEGRLNAKGKDKDAKEGKETKEGKDTKDTKEKDTKEGKDKEGKDHKDGKDKDTKEHKDGKEHKDKDHKDVLDKVQRAEKQIDHLRLQGVVPGQPEPPREQLGEARTFITLEDRPDVEATALADDKPTAEKAPAKETSAKKAPAKKTTAKKTPAKKSTAKKAPVKETTAPKTAARKSAAKKTAAPPSGSAEG